MTGNWDYKRALEELWNRSSYERGLISDPFGGDDRAKRGLRRMRALLAHLGDPHQRVPSVHVAGTKGKGSTASFIAAAACTAGHHTGLYSSPHLHRFPERIALDGEPLPDAGFAAIAETVAAAARALESMTPEHGEVTTFEFITAMAFAEFYRAGCDLAVIEVGLGGLYDATNVLDPLVTVITRLDLEHTAVLGSTIEEIAAQKAGIIRPGVPCVSSPQAPNASKVLSHLAAEANAPFLLGGRDWRWHGGSRSFDATGPWGSWEGLSLGTPGPHQVENACTALAALHELNQAGIEIPESAIRESFASARWPGRFERYDLDDRTVVFDGAHTPAAATALVETWQSEIGSRKATIVLGMGADKDFRAFLEALQPIVGRLLITRADSPRAAEPRLIAGAARDLGIETEIVPSVASGFSRALSIDRSPVLLTGSLFVAGEGREALGIARADDMWRELNEARLPRTNAP